MVKVKVKLNSSGVRSFLKNDMQKVLDQRGNELLSLLPDGYEKEIYVGKNRANCTVRVTELEAIRDNNANNTLIKALYSS